VFGSKSGFNSLEECFEDLTCHIHALETGLSSDPPMNRRLSALDDYILVSNSDAHSPAKFGREANRIDTDLDYNQMTQAMTGGKGFLGTLEFFPEEGKYHLDGHRKCQVGMQPGETNQANGICPKCGRPLTVGVLHRVDDLSDRRAPKLSKKFYSLIPLTEVLSELFDCGPATKTVLSVYETLLLEMGPELQILMDQSLSDIKVLGGPLLAEAIARMRRNKVICQEGYDGQYGIIRLFDKSEKQAVRGQMALFKKKPIKRPQKQDTAPHQKKNKGIRPKAPPATRPALTGDPILDPLNPEQKSAALHEAGSLLVKAGPGTGKTLTLTHRIAQLIRAGHASPDQVLALTFTRKAAREIEQRISRLLEGSGQGQQVHVATFHGFCAEILRTQGDKSGLPTDFTLCSEMDAENLAREVLAESGVGKRATGEFLKALPTIKAALVLNSGQRPLNHKLVPLFEKYQHRLRDLRMLDLDDLEVESLRLLRDHPVVCKRLSRKFPWIFVDEYQDTNTIQVALLKTLIQAGPCSICAIGDPDQAIYGFRGAEVKNFHCFVEDFPGAKEIALTRNYRSTRPILQGSAALMGKEKPLQCESPGEDPILLAPCRTDSEEAEMIVEQVERLLGGTTYFSLDSGRVSSHEEDLSLGFGDIGVLFRLNAQGDALEKAMDRSGIPFIRSGQIPLVSRYPIDILWRFFQTLQYPDNPYYAKLYEGFFPEGSMKRKEAMGIFRANMSLTELIDGALKFHDFDCSSEESKDALRRLKQIAADFGANVEAFLDSLSLERGIDHATFGGDRVALMSLHAAKGLEWPVVFITGCEDQLIPCSLFGSRDDQEERRLFYVGMTRARSRLILSHVNRRNLNGRGLNMNPSPFLGAIPKDICIPLDRRGWRPKKRPHKQLELF
jgi:DNA helicase-2/ATP-dependent DNA helicase PcrA